MLFVKERINMTGSQYAIVLGKIIEVNYND